MLFRSSLELEGMELVVEPLALLRTQRTFENFEALSHQIGEDAAAARQLCASYALG